MKAKWLALALLALQAPLPSEPEAVAGRRPNVLFIMADQVRTQELPYVTTPNIDRLGNEGVCFAHAIATGPVCSVARVGVLAGRRTHQPGGDKLQVGERDIAEIFKQAGYWNAYVGKWHVTPDAIKPAGSEYVPSEIRPDWDSFIGVELGHNYFPPAAVYYVDDDPTPRVYAEYEAYGQTRQAIAQMVLAAGRDQPFLMFVSYGIPHTPYEPPPEFDTHLPSEIVLRPNILQEYKGAARASLAKYYGMIECLDYCIGKLLGTLELLGIAEDTIVVLYSDHGDLHFSHFVPNSVVVGSKKRVIYEEAVRVPLYVRYPARVPAQRPSDTLVGTIDVLPTLLGLADIPVPEDLTGIDFSPLLRGESQERPSSVYCGMVEPNNQQPFGSPWRGVVARFEDDRGTTEWSYQIGEKAKYEWLFDNTTDPFQRRNLVGLPKHEPMRAELLGLTKQYAQALGDPFDFD